jgi:hypothetical protein
MRKQELRQIHLRFFNSPNEGTFYQPAKHQKPTGTLIWNSSVNGTFLGSVRDYLLNRRKA